jgi:hypothetical protein
MQDPYLQDIVSPESAALLVVDVQNDFCHQDGLFGQFGAEMRAVQAAAKRICEVLPHARNAGVPVIFVTMQHDPLTNSPAWNRRYASSRKDACIAGTWGAAFYEVQPLPGEPVVVKHRYSPFVGSNIQYLLRARRRNSLLVTGVATNICVESVLPLVSLNPPMPAISILLPCHNAEATLEEALASLAAQTHPDFEIVVVDDGSTDASPEILAAWAGRDGRFRVIRMEHGGIVAALQAGLAACRGDLVARMDADDRCTPDRLVKQARFLRATPDVDVAGCLVEHFPPETVREGFAI